MNEGREKETISAGGVVYRRLEGHTDIILISVGQNPRWQLPKGMVDPGETVEGAARREVREEAGVEADLQAPLDTIEYWFYSVNKDHKQRVHKFVHFYLFEYISGDPADHDHEVNEARWVELDQALAMVRFDSEKRVLRRAKELLAS